LIILLNLSVAVGGATLSKIWFADVRRYISVFWKRCIRWQEFQSASQANGHNRRTDAKDEVAYPFIKWTLFACPCPVALGKYHDATTFERYPSIAYQLNLPR
jgi:hypothetical protein